MIIGDDFRAQDESRDEEADVRDIFRIRDDLGALERARQGLYARLGERVYRAAQDDAGLRERNPDLMDELDALGVREEALWKEIAQVIRSESEVGPWEEAEDEERAPEVAEDAPEPPSAYAPVEATDEEEGSVEEELPKWFITTGTSPAVNLPRAEPVAEGASDDHREGVSAPGDLYADVEASSDQTSVIDAGATKVIESLTQGRVGSQATGVFPHTMLVTPGSAGETSVRFCPECGTRAEPGDLFCMECGTRLPEPPAIAVGEDEPKDQAAPVEGQVAVVADTSLAETNVNEAADLATDPEGERSQDAAPAGDDAPEAAERVCPACGTRAEPGDLFCMECGTRLPDFALADAVADATEGQAMSAGESQVAEVAAPFFDTVIDLTGDLATDPEGERGQDAAPAGDDAPAAAERVCPACGAPAEEGDLFCIECGMRLEEPAATRGSDKPDGATTATIIDVAPVPDSPSSSPEPAGTDGEDRPVRPRVNVCPSCGALTKAGDEFCMRCGMRIDGRDLAAAGGHRSTSTAPEGQERQARGAAPVVLTVCPYCGAPLHSDNGPCERCGRRFVWPSQRDARASGASDRGRGSGDGAGSGSAWPETTIPDGLDEGAATHARQAPPASSGRRTWPKTVNLRQGPSSSLDANDMFGRSGYGTTPHRGEHAYTNAASNKTILRYDVDRRSRRLCPVCHQELKLSDQFCGWCGTRVV